MRVLAIHLPEIRERGVLARICETSLAFGATTSFDAEASAVWIDVTGCAHLHGGEPELAARVEGRVREMGHACRIAIASGPRVAYAVARYAAVARPIVVPAGENAAAMHALPLSALPLGEALHWLVSLGLATVGDLARLPKGELGSRLGGRAAEVMTLIAGEDRSPLVPYVPPEIPQERADLEYGISGKDALVFVASTLASRLAGRLEGRAMATTKLELVLSLDTAAARLASKTREVTIPILLPSPLAAAKDLLGVLRVRIEQLSIPAPILAVTLRAIELVPRPSTPLSLFEPEARADRALPRLVAELIAELGDDRVGTLALGDSWLPERRSVLVPVGVKGRSVKGGRLTQSVPEPSRVLATPHVIDKRDVRFLRLLSRVESVEWWRTDRSPRDYFSAWVEPSSSAWVEVNRKTGIARVLGWMD